MAKKGISEAARTLGSRGGDARKKALSKKQRVAIASQGGNAKAKKGKR